MVRIEKATAESIARAAEILHNGGLVAFPTETVYGLGADATNDRAVARVFAAKGRPDFNPLIVHIAESEAARRIVAWSDAAEKLARRFWPGPLTMVLPRRADARVSLLASAGLDSLGVRLPDHPVARQLIAAADTPIVAPSANPSGRLSPTTAEHVAESMGFEVDLVLDGGPCRVGIESTVVDLTADIPAVLRPGAVSVGDLTSVIGRVEAGGSVGPIKSPGLLAGHYAPRLPLRLNATTATAEEAFLAFGSNEPTGAGALLNLSPKGDLVEAAARLFAYLRSLDRSGLKGIAAAPIPDAGLGHAINDRLRRAAATGPK
jgi:L-threonylcarbamoyladenylate synthase